VEAQEVLDSIKEHCLKLGVPLPEMAVVDNCCSVQNFLVRSIVGLEVVLDVYHFMMRYVIHSEPHVDTDDLIYLIWP
jgi:hypothetical protein